MAVLNPHLYLAERSNDLFFIYDLSTDRFTYVNRSFAEFFNQDFIQLSPRVLLRTIHPDDQRYILSKLKACTDGQHVSDVECRVMRGSNERWLRINPHLVNEPGDQLLVGQAEDITTYKGNVEVLENTNNKKNSILTILAHDLAGPLGTIGNLTTLLSRETAKLENPSVERYINMITKISKSSINLIRDFLDQEFLETAGVRLLKRRVDLFEKISLATKEYLDMQKELHIQFSCQANKDHVFVEVDEDKFMQAINNLISNALKFTPDGGKIEINIQESKKEVLISIADTGIGIPEKYHATLFDKFNDARRSGLKGEHSTGLGMSIIKTIVEWHEGNIWFKSEEHKGTTFYIQLPKA
jgi:two-component system sensor histidine kinase VicK